MSLTQKQENFCLAYIETGNASEAYRRSYNASNMKPETVVVRASELMSKSNIKVRVEELRGKAESKAIMTREEALERLTRMARVRITDVAEFREDIVGEDDKGNPVKATNWRIRNSDELSEEAAASIKSVTATKLGPKLEMHDPMTALNQLSKMQGWEAAQKFDHSSTDGSMSPRGLDDFYSDVKAEGDEG